jgi:FkbM family methyltransferase
MKFVTYAQNFEDLMLHRALKNVDGGFYIDLGAAEPEMHSVTKAFYEKGWKGINVEPGSGPFKRLVNSRVRDINLNVGIWSRKGPLKMYFVAAENELSTTNLWLMQQHKAAGWPVREEIISVTTLSDICEEHVQDQEIHFLKVDVEGAEVEAFKGHDFKRWRPWIIVVESHEPERVSQHWVPVEELVIEGGYTFVYCDGLNRFYLANERYDELHKAFETPPNIYDNWIRAEERDLEDRCVRTDQDLRDAWEQLRAAQDQVRVLQMQALGINHDQLFRIAD